LIDPDTLPASGAAAEKPSGALDPAVDQALDWLIRLESPSPEDCVAFDAWLAAAPEHAEAFAKAAGVWQGATVRQAADNLQARRTPRLGQRLMARWKPLATAAVLLIGLFSFSNVPLCLQADYLTQVGERQRVELPDGSKVLLNTQSAIASTFDIDHHRTRLLQGEAFFEVGGSPALPLEVQAGPVLASVHDTAFAVSYREGEAQVKVQRGNVDLLANDAQSLRLSAGDSVRIGPQGFARRERMDPAADLAWVQGRLVFEDRPLGQVLAELRRYYPGWIVSRNAQREAMKVTGNYRLDQPRDVLRSLAHVTSANLQEYPGVVIFN
jgi:transmembrane sensor